LPVPAGPASTHEPDLADADAAWTWLRTERPNLLAALNHTGVHAQPDRTIVLTAGLATLLRTDGTWSQAITLHTVAVAIARDLGDRTHQAHALIQLGEVRGATGDYPGAERDLHEALNLFRDLGVRRGQAQALTLLGHRHGLAGDYPGAQRDLHEAVALYRGLDDRRGQSHALTLLGQERGLTGDYPGAARDLQEALGLCRGRGDRHGQAYCLVDLAHVWQATGDYRVLYAPCTKPWTCAGICEEIDLSRLEPLIAMPSSPGNVVPVREVAGQEIHQAYVGSSANPGYRDFAVAAEIVKGKRIHDRVSFDINPTSRQILENLVRDGHLLNLIHAGGRIHQAGCNGCIGMGQAPATDKISLRTVPRNFPGRSGNREDKVCLVSPETAAASALTGVITDPRDLDMAYPRIPDPDQPMLNYQMLFHRFRSKRQHG